MTGRPLSEWDDLHIAFRLARLDNETGGCLAARTARAVEIRALVSEQDRRTAEALWALPVRAQR